MEFKVVNLSIHRSGFEIFFRGRRPDAPRGWGAWWLKEKFQSALWLQLRLLTARLLKLCCTFYWQEELTLLAAFVECLGACEAARPQWKIFMLNAAPPSRKTKQLHIHNGDECKCKTISHQQDTARSRDAYNQPTLFIEKCRECALWIT